LSKILLLIYNQALRNSSSCSLYGIMQDIYVALQQISRLFYIKMFFNWFNNMISILVSPLKPDTYNYS
jgi:hypothetical protein